MAIAQEVVVRKEEGNLEADDAVMIAQMQDFFASLPADRFPHILSMDDAIRWGCGGAFRTRAGHPRRRADRLRPTRQRSGLGPANHTG